MYLPPPTLIETHKLTTHPNNPRFIRKSKMKDLIQSIGEDPKFMCANPLWVNPQMVVFAGNQRLRACRALEWPVVPCIVLDWTEEEQERAMIKHNGRHGEWDQDALANGGWKPEQLQPWGVNIDWDKPKEPEEETEKLKPCKHCDKMIP